MELSFHKLRNKDSGRKVTCPKAEGGRAESKVQDSRFSGQRFLYSTYFLSGEHLALSSFSSFQNGIKGTQKGKQIVWGHLAGDKQSQV